MKRAFADLPVELRRYWRLFAEQADALLSTAEREQLRRFETRVESLFGDGYTACPDEEPFALAVDPADTVLALVMVSGRSR